MTFGALAAHVPDSSADVRLEVAVRARALPGRVQREIEMSGDAWTQLRDIEIADVALHPPSLLPAPQRSAPRSCALRAQSGDLGAVGSAGAGRETGRAAATCSRRQLATRNSPLAVQREVAAAPERGSCRARYGSAHRQRRAANETELHSPCRSSRGPPAITVTLPAASTYASGGGMSQLQPRDGQHRGAVTAAEFGVAGTGAQARRGSTCPGRENRRDRPRASGWPLMTPSASPAFQRRSSKRRTCE